MAHVGAVRGVLLLDSGGISALGEANPTARAVLVRARRDGRQVATPSVVLAEIVTGSAADANINRVIKAVDEELELTSERARQAGALRARAWELRRTSPRRDKDSRAPSAVDAVVMAEAVAAGAAVILTSDPREMELLRDAAGLTPAEIQIVSV